MFPAGAEESLAGGAEEAGAEESLAGGAEEAGPEESLGGAEEAGAEESLGAGGDSIPDVDWKARLVCLFLHTFASLNPKPD